MPLAFVREIHRRPVFPAQRASTAENVSIWWRHHDHVVITAPFDGLSLLNARASADAVITESVSSLYTGPILGSLNLGLLQHVLHDLCFGETIRPISLNTPLLIFPQTVFLAVFCWRELCLSLLYWSKFLAHSLCYAACLAKILVVFMKLMLVIYTWMWRHHIYRLISLYRDRSHRLAYYVFTP